MAYSELIKNFDKIRDYMREFFVYGFRTRTEFEQKSARSYDNERRRIESWLSDYMAFKQDENGKNVFISVDSREVRTNPLYKAFKAKSFTDKDITLHFYLLDYLADGQKKTIKDIVDAIHSEYLNCFETDMDPDDSTIRNKIKEYVNLGVLAQEKQGKEMLYYRKEQELCLDTLYDGIFFAAESNPAGVIGSFLLDKYENKPEYFSFKHHYLLEALDQEILIQLMLGRKKRSKVEVTYRSRYGKAEKKFVLFPLKFYVSTQNGKQYVLAYFYEMKRPKIFRLDRIVKVQEIEPEKNADLYDSYGEKYRKHLWGISDGKNQERDLEHIEMTLSVGPKEDYIIQRLKREKRCGSVEAIDAHTIKFIADVYDTQEMVPWMRTFIGRIQKLEGSNQEVIRDFYEDIQLMKDMYGR